MALFIDGIMQQICLQIEANKQIIRYTFQNKHFVKMDKVGYSYSYEKLERARTILYQK